MFRYSRMRKSQLLASIQEVQRTKVSFSPSRTLEAQEAVEAAKFELGQKTAVVAPQISIRV